MKKKKIINKLLISLYIGDDSRVKPLDKFNQLVIPQYLPNSSFSSNIKNISFVSTENEEKDEQASNESKNPYLKKDDVPLIEWIGKNNIIICDKEEYKIKDYIEKTNSIYNDLLDDEIYYYCGKCKNNFNKFFCNICNKNI